MLPICRRVCWVVFLFYNVITPELSHARNRADCVQTLNDYISRKEQAIQIEEGMAHILARGKDTLKKNFTTIIDDGQLGLFHILSKYNKENEDFSKRSLFSNSYGNLDDVNSV